MYLGRRGCTVNVKRSAAETMTRMEVILVISVASVFSKKSDMLLLLNVYHIYELETHRDY